VTPQPEFLGLSGHLRRPQLLRHWTGPQNVSIVANSRGDTNSAENVNLYV